MKSIHFRRPSQATTLQPKMLQIGSIKGKTLLLAIVFFCLFYLAGEMVARTRPFQVYLTHQTWGSRHRAFEMQLSRLDWVYNQEGSIDCIFLGNSMVWRGFDPEAFSKGFRVKTGQDLRCFNFGVDGLPASNAGAIAEILIHDYRPQLMIYGTEARDYAVPPETQDARVLAEMAWLKYRQGQFSFQGWLVDRSELFRYRPSLQNLLRFNYQYTARELANQPVGSRYGFDPDTRVRNVAIAPDRNNPEGHIQYYYQLLANYQMLPENLVGLREVLSQHQAVDDLVVVELPVPPTYMLFFNNRDKDYQVFIDQVSELTEEHQVLFLETTPWNTIPDDGWVDYSHLNQKGARIFSQMLGEKVGTAVMSGELANPND